MIALYARTIGGYFLADDFANVVAGSTFPLWRWPLLFFRDLSEGAWGVSLDLLRPLAVLAGIIQCRLFLADATGYRVVSLALHIINVWLLFAVVRSSFGRSIFAAFTAALLFAVHPIHAETVAWIAGQSDLLPTALFLGALLSFIRFRRNGSWREVIVLFGLALCAVFTKENTVVLPLLMFAYDALHFRRRRSDQIPRPKLHLLLPYFGILLVLVAYFTCRRIAFGGAAGVPVAAASLLTLWQTLATKYLEYSSYLLWRPALLWPAALLVIAAAVVAIKARQWEALRSITFFGPLWFVLTTAPFLFTFNYPRHMYVVAAGLCALIAATMGVLVPARYWLVRATLVTLLTCSCVAANVPAVNRWVETGIISKNMHRTIRRLATKPPGSVLILDLPGAIRDAHLFHWSSPFLLREPFCSPPLTVRFLVLEAPPSYYNDWFWPQHSAIDQIAKIDLATPAYLVVYDEHRGGRHQKLDATKLRDAAARLRLRLSSNPEMPLRLHWREFIDSAR